MKEIGDQLRQARLDQQLTVEQAAKATLIRAHFLNALEEGDFDALPSMVQVRGFLRSYAAFLGLDGDLLINTLAGSSQPATPAPDKSAPAPARAATPAAIRAEAEQASVQATQASLLEEIGKQLRARRELLNLSLTDVERHTHLRSHYLRALEAGLLEDLPSPVQARGMLKNYAVFLGMDPEPLMLQFANALQTGLAARHPVEPSRPRPAAPPSPPPAWRRFFSADLFWTVLLTLGLVVFVVWGINQVSSLSRQSDDPSPTGLSVAEALLQTETPTPTASLPAGTPLSPLPVTTDPAGGQSDLQDTPNPEVTQPVILPSGAIQLTVSARQRGWLRVVVDGEVEFQGLLVPGNAASYSANESIELNAGNGAAVHIVYNQQDLGLMGGFGQAITRIYTRQGVLNPTPTITPTPSNTPRVTPGAP